MSACGAHACPSPTPGARRLTRRTLLFRGGGRNRPSFPAAATVFTGQLFLGGFELKSVYVGGFVAPPLLSAVSAGHPYLYHIAPIPGQTSSTPDVFVVGTFPNADFAFEVGHSTTGSWRRWAHARVHGACQHVSRE